MLTTLFQDWLCDFDRQVGQKHRGQRVLLLLDNCTSHKLGSLDLLNVDVHFLPPNTTSKIQPMDAGIIMSFKKHYRYYHIRYVYFIKFITLAFIIYNTCLKLALKKLIEIISLFSWILERIEAGQFIQDLKMDVLQALLFKAGMKLQQKRSIIVGITPRSFLILSIWMILKLMMISKLVILC